jgi:hypothetical protein
MDRLAHNAHHIVLKTESFRKGKGLFFKAIGNDSSMIQTLECSTKREVARDSKPGNQSTVISGLVVDFERGTGDVSVRSRTEDARDPQMRFRPKLASRRRSKLRSRNAFRCPESRFGRNPWKRDIPPMFGENCNQRGSDPAQKKCGILKMTRT